MAIKSFRGKYFFLSNFFYHSDITVEHQFQMAKSVYPDVRYAIRTARSPGDAKRMGRNVRLRSDWEQVKVDIMYNILCGKFAKEPLRSKLIATRDEYLEEGNNHHDNFWGNCTCPKCKSKEGKNILGQLLMKVRQELIESEDWLSQA